MKRFTLLLAALPVVLACATNRPAEPTPVVPPPPPPAAPSSMLVYIGTYTSENGSRGIYRAKLDASSGALSTPELAAEVRNPSFLAIHPNGRFLYAVSEVSDANGAKTGAVSAFAIGADGGLTLLNHVPSRGAGPCHVSVTASGKHVLVANYGGGSVAAFPVEADGRLKPDGGFVQHQGSSVNPRRQKEPHAHSIFEGPGGRVFAADLGMDKVLVYNLDPATGALTPNDPPFGAVPAGGGPRHIAFHPTGRFVFTNDELTSAVTVFALDAGRGAMTEVQTTSTLPAGFSESNSTAQIVTSPDGRFLYVSNRGHNSVAIFAIDEASGRLSPLGHEPTRGKTPRNFNIDPTGAFLLAANQDTGNVVVFKRDAGTGLLQATGHEIAVPRPVCVAFLAR